MIVILFMLKATRQHVSKGNDEQRFGAKKEHLTYVPEYQQWYV